MTEEEKEAINNVDKFVDTIMVILPKYSTKIPEYCIKEQDWLSIKRVLNYIEKLQNENTELKSKKQLEIDTSEEVLKWKGKYHLLSRENRELKEKIKEYEIGKEQE